MTRGIGAAGSAFDWQSRGHEFEPRMLHHRNRWIINGSFLFFAGLKGPGFAVLKPGLYLFSMHC